MTKATQNEEIVKKDKNNKWQIFIIGIFLGFFLPFTYIMMNFIFSIDWYAVTIGDFPILILTSIIWGVPLSIFGVIGAFMGNKLKDNSTGTLVGALLGSILCVVILHFMQLNYMCTLGC